MAIKERFEIPAATKTWSMALIIIGALAFILGIITKGVSTDEHEKAVFIGTIMYNTIFWLLACNACMFFICATTLAMGSWTIVFRRVPEAISTLVPIFCGVLFFIFLYIIFFDHNHHIYHWLDSEAVEKDPILKGKSGFLNPVFFIGWTAFIMILWTVLGSRMRKLGDEAEQRDMNLEESKRYTWKSTVRSAMFIISIWLSTASTIPWLWMMSIDAHWYSTMYSWYTFISSFVTGLSMMALFVIYLKNKGYLEYANNEHLHDIGKFMFAFSIFWTYLWFSQYMLIWYGNISEETIYFKHRVDGPYKGIFFFNIIINFVCPILILMKRSTKRNYSIMTFVAALLIFGHWIDFFQMVMGSISPGEVSLSWFDFGIAALFIGLIIHFTTRALASKPMLIKHHPFLKESIIHHT